MENYENRMAVVVTKYLSPFALLLIALGIVLAQSPGPFRNITLGLLVFGLVFNWVMVLLIKEEGAGRGWVMGRLFVNVFVNTITVYLMAVEWPPIWLLLALSPIAAAIYSSRRHALAVVGIVSGVMLMLHFMR